MHSFCDGHARFLCGGSPFLEVILGTFHSRHCQFCQRPLRGYAKPIGAKMRSFCHFNEPALFQFREPRANRIAMHVQRFRRIPVSTSGIRGLILPPIPGELIIAADGDEPGREAADRLARDATALGWDVSMMPAPKGMDFNDVLQSGVSA